MFLYFPKYLHLLFWIISKITFIQIYTENRNHLFVTLHVFTLAPIFILLSCKSKLSATEFSSSFPPTPQSCFLNVTLTMMIAMLINTHYLALKCTRLFSFFLGDLHDLPWNYTHSLNSLLNVLFYLLLNGNPLQYSYLENPMDWGAW